MPGTLGASLPTTAVRRPARTCSLRRWTPICGSRAPLADGAVVDGGVSDCADAVWAPAQVNARQSTPATARRATFRGPMSETSLDVRPGCLRGQLTGSRPHHRPGAVTGAGPDARRYRGSSRGFAPAAAPFRAATMG